MITLIKKSVKISIFMLILMALMNVYVAPVGADQGSDSLEVDVRIHNGEALMAKEGCPLYSSCPLDFIIKCDPSCEMFYSLSVDGGKTFGRFVKTDDSSVTLYPDTTICPSGEFGLKFKAVGMPDESGETRSYESSVFKVVFDFDVPEIKMADENVWDEWLDGPGMLRLIAQKETGYLSRIVARSGSNVFFEKHFDAGEGVREFDFEIPLYDQFGFLGNSINVSVEDEAKNVNETLYTYYPRAADDFADTSGGDEEINENRRDEVIVAENDFLAPVISISGPSDGECIKGPCELGIGVNDECYEGGTVSVKIVRTCLDNSVVLPIPDYGLMAVTDTRNITLNSDGDYVMRVVAKDGFGNEAVTDRKFRIDSTAPDIRIVGPGGKNVIGASDSVDVCIREMFYDTTYVNVKIEKKKSNGEYDLYSCEDYMMKEASDCYTPENLEEGEYKMVVSASDLCGNIARDECEFLVDRTPPEVGELADIDGMFLDSFCLKSHMKTVITDKSAVSVSASLNDCEITENDVIIGEGRYRLRVEASDEAGNSTGREAVFVIDHTVPQIVISGADKEGSVRFGSSINVSLFDENDTLTSVSFDGRDVAIINNEAVIKVDGYGDHKLSVTAVDKAGNKVKKDIAAGCPIVKNPVSKYVNVEKKQSSNLVNNDNFDDEFARLAVGLFTVLSGTCGLSFRAFTCN